MFERYTESARRALAAGEILKRHGMTLAHARSELAALLDRSAGKHDGAATSHADGIINGLTRRVRIAQLRHFLDRLEHTTAGSDEAREVMESIRVLLDGLIN